MPAASLRPPEADCAERPSYSQILRSSALIGSASAFNLVIGILRTKAIAILLGPAGIGLLGVLTSISDLARSLAQLGINASGVRQIAEAAASNDAQRIARTVTVLRRVAVLLGLCGMAAMCVLSRLVSQWAFGSPEYAGPIAWLSLALFFRLVADGQAALFQGMRNIGTVAKVGVFGSLAGMVLSIAAAALMGQDGIVPGLVASAAVTFFISWVYARKIQIHPVSLKGLEVRAEALSLLRLGLAFMVSAILMTGAAFAVRSIVLRQGGVEAAGFYQAAWTLGGMYVGFVLQAMGTDYYPRLVGVITDPTRAGRLVNEQAHVSLLLAGPGVVATLLLASLALTMFYSPAFEPAAPAMRWLCMGMALRVISWPMGYIILAMNRRVAFVATEMAWAVANVGLSWVFVARFGLEGAGIALFVSYVLHIGMIFVVVRRLTGFRVLRSTWIQAGVFVAAIALIYGSSSWLPASLALLVGSVVLAASVVYSTLSLANLAPDLLPPSIRRGLAYMRRQGGQPK
jgi:enterobacterial common antigen flippase